MDTNIIKILARQFKSCGYELYEVGGHIRDEIMGRIPNDIDLTTDALPEETETILDNFCLDRVDSHVYTVGKEYGTVGLTFDDGTKIEITTFRKEVYPTDSRKPNVTFGDNLKDDLARRDFTINTISRDPITREIIDPFWGMIDIAAGLIRCVGSPDRLDEDPLRMMRAVRFACQLGFIIDIPYMHPNRLQIISSERIRDELIKILMSSRASFGIRQLYRFGLIEHVIPEFLKLMNLKQGHNHIKDAYEHTLSVLDKASRCDSLVLRLAALLHDIAKPATISETETGIHFYDHHTVGEEMARDILTRLKFDSEIIDRVSNLVGRHMEPIMLAIHGGLNKRAVSRLIRRLSTDKYDDTELLLTLVECDLSSTASPRGESVQQLRELVKEVQTVLPKQKSPINGEEIMALLNIKPSKLVGEIKDYIIEQIAEGLVKPEEKETLFSLAKFYYENNKE